MGGGQDGGQMKLGLTQRVRDNALFVFVAPVLGKPCCLQVFPVLISDSIRSAFFGFGSSEFKNTLGDDDMQNVLFVPLGSLLSGGVWVLALGRPGCGCLFCPSLEG